MYGIASSVLFLIFLPLLVYGNEIRIAHLMPSDSHTVLEANVMQIALNDLRNRSILPREMELK
jgi:hypothetical protein